MKKIPNVPKELTKYFKRHGVVRTNTKILSREYLLNLIYKMSPSITGADTTEIILKFYQQHVQKERLLIRKSGHKKSKKRRIKAYRINKFYLSKEWIAVRYAALKKHGARCQCCGASAADGAKMNVDHIKPRSRYPELALDISNLQVLCARCNEGKGYADETDWRSPDDDWKKEAEAMNEAFRATIN